MKVPERNIDRRVNVKQQQLLANKIMIESIAVRNIIVSSHHGNWPLPMSHPRIEILNQDTDFENILPSYFRILVDGKRFKYITIDPGTYLARDLCSPSLLAKKLPPLPSEGDAESWNLARISLVGGIPTVVEAFKAALPTIDSSWFPKPISHIDYLSLKFIRKLEPNVHLVSSPAFDKPVIAKVANFYWETDYIAKIQVYSWLHNCNVLIPKFLGYITEGGRVIGLLTENVEGRRATIADLSLCQTLIRKLHKLGIMHGSLDENKFLISQGKAVLVSLDTAERCEDKKTMEKEMELFAENLQAATVTNSN
ncbi:putative alpha-galactosidase a precursor protein [Botrytis fragariae]|uniref:Putative alpha-galactosidase a protein n=1 Tax=Botrytis fragariae TaxID=1964551 RepID=A0A8H6EN48_9HELO|nr:putative alpha-galactosidase a precursor protein [Botrytis fragariae]KAF5878234.1 putative alpha-galactosidase a precursor protein [Botrytis fragariae]